MGNPFCEVDGCNRFGIIELEFPSEHHAGAHEPRHSLICDYHAMAAAEYFASFGYFAPITTKAKPIVSGSSYRHRRYSKRKAIDNADYEHRYGE